MERNETLGQLSVQAPARAALVGAGPPGFPDRELRPLPLPRPSKAIMGPIQAAETAGVSEGGGLL